MPAGPGGNRPCWSTPALMCGVQGLKMKPRKRWGSRFERSRSDEQGRLTRGNGVLVACGCRRWETKPLLVKKVILIGEANVLSGSGGKSHAPFRFRGLGVRFSKRGGPGRPDRRQGSSQERRC